MQREIVIEAEPRALRARFLPMSRAAVTVRVFRILAGCAALLLVWLFVHNAGDGYFRSGYGYDALEYLVIGRSLNDGFPLYTFIPSKSWGLYALVAGFLRLPYASTHVGVSLLVTLLLALVGAMTYRAMAAVFDRGIAVVAAALVVAGGLFMELTYLEPEGAVLIATLLAFSAVARRGATPSIRRFFIAGVWIGAGMAFKSVAALGAIGLMFWTIGSPQAWQRFAALLAGMSVTVAIPALYFWWTGRWQEHVLWSLVFPLWEYPANTLWASKLLTKLWWAWAVVGGALVLARSDDLRARVGRTSTAGLLLCMGLVSLAPLVKTQASHYAFPGAALLLCYSAVVLAEWGRAHGFARPSIVAAVGVAGAACLLSAAVLYRPGTLTRFLTVQRYSDEPGLTAALGRLIPPDKRAIFFTRGTALYWIADRYPPWPVLNNDVQTTYAVSRRGAQMLKALEDPALALVEFDPRAVLIGDERLATSEAGRRFLADFRSRLIAGFDRRDDLVPPLVLWLPKATPSARAQTRRIG